MKIVTHVAIVLFAFAGYGCSCEQWDAEARAKEWAQQMGLKNAKVTCHLSGDSCVGTCTVAFDTGGQLGRTVISMTCVAPDSFGKSSGTCWKRR